MVSQCQELVNELLGSIGENDEHVRSLAFDLEDQLKLLDRHMLKVWEQNSKVVQRASEMAKHMSDIRTRNMALLEDAHLRRNWPEISKGYELVNGLHGSTFMERHSLDGKVRERACAQCFDQGRLQRLSVKHFRGEYCALGCMSCETIVHVSISSLRQNDEVRHMDAQDNDQRTG
jgi:hypothetical protein